MNINLYFIILLSVAKCFSQQTTNITAIKVLSGLIVDVNINETVILECAYEHSMENNWIWFKVDEHKIIISIDNLKITKNSRYFVSNNSTLSSYKLQINNVQLADAGIYQCHLSLTNPELKKNITLNVRHSPIILTNTTEYKVAFEGDKVILECLADGYPKPNIFWRRENNVQFRNGGTHNGTTYIINSVSRKDAGIYFCIANNGVGTENKHMIHLIIEFTPFITVSQENIGQALQYDVTFECMIEGYPTPAIYWLKDDVFLYNNAHFSVSNLYITESITKSSLLIITIEKRQYGNYSCHAANKIGFAEQTLLLYETNLQTYPPDYIEMTEIQNSTETTISYLFPIGLF